MTDVESILKLFFLPKLQWITDYVLFLSNFLGDSFVGQSTEAIPIKCFVSHRLPSREGGSVGRSGQKKNKRNKHMIAY